MLHLLRKTPTLCLAAALAFAVAATGASAEIQQRTLKLGHLSTADSVNGLGLRKFAELVDERSNGMITIQIFDSGQLGNEVQQIGALQGGLQEFAYISSSPLASIVPGLQVLDFPGLMTTREEAFALLDGPIGQGMLEEFSARNLIGLGYWENGFRQFTNSRRPIHTLEDFAGLKVRVIQNPIYIDLFRQLGANPVPMAYTELYTALETNMVDGQDNAMSTNVMARFDEVQRYLTITNHIYNAMILVGSKAMWDTMSDQEREIIATSATDAGIFQRALSEAQEQEQIAHMETQGMVVNVLSPEVSAQMNETLTAVVEKYTSMVGEEFVKAAYAEVEKVRASK